MNNTGKISHEYRHLFEGTSGTWKFIQAWGLDQIAVLNLQNEEIGLGRDKTNAIRGAIDSMKALLALGAPKKDVESYGIDKKEQY